MMKIRYDIDPRDYALEDAEGRRKIVHEHVLFEIDLMTFLHSIGHGPRLLTTCYYCQKEGRPYPAGYMYAIVMKCVPGEDVDEIRDDLSEEQLQSIRTQLTSIFEKMRHLNRVLNTSDPGCLQYDKENDKLYIVDLTRWGYRYMGTEEIQEDNPFAMAFILWQDEPHTVNNDTTSLSLSWPFLASSSASTTESEQREFSDTPMACEEGDVATIEENQFLDRAHN